MYSPSCIEGDIIVGLCGRLFFLLFFFPFVQAETEGGEERLNFFGGEIGILGFRVAICVFALYSFFLGGEGASYGGGRKGGFNFRDWMDSFVWGARKPLHTYLR